MKIILIGVATSKDALSMECGFEVDANDADELRINIKDGLVQSIEKRMNHTERIYP